MIGTAEVGSTPSVPQSNWSRVIYLRIFNSTQNKSGKERNRETEREREREREKRGVCCVPESTWYPPGELPYQEK
ncbi:hypothetical protein M747DRAFT_82155 [Aspergillus niger ATCC 13496]|uniref:Uncharacterized protein n=1 Tax=Aspergillus niger ATCC 13496 TaxID=1353008 RepID=A0A370BUM3_ASPNG|nr:hypothetical protein M747DRAFT_82155 [Aspergillus niger ATCC 13496]